MADKINWLPAVIGAALGGILVATRIPDKRIAVGAAVIGGVAGYGIADFIEDRSPGRVLKRAGKAVAKGAKKAGKGVVKGGKAIGKATGRAGRAYGRAVKGVAKARVKNARQGARAAKKGARRLKKFVRSRRRRR